MSQPISKRALNRPLAALLRELQPLVGGMLMFTRKAGGETADDLLAQMEALRGYAGEMGRLLAKYDTMARRGAALPVLVRLADRLDAAGAHAMADVADEAARLLRTAQATQTPQQQLAQQQQQQATLQQLADRFLNIHTEMLNATRLFSNPATIPSGMKRLLDSAREIGFAANALKQSVTTTTTTAPQPIPATTTAVPGGPAMAPTASALGELVALANRLDAEGKHAMADVADRAAEMVLRFSGKREENEEPIRPASLTPLSTRYCPDHRGIQAYRVAERVYQCPVDGRMYDYEGGYVDYNGQRVPGGSIANQTPTTMPYQLPQRLYDPNQYVLNTMN